MRYVEGMDGPTPVGVEPDRSLVIRLRLIKNGRAANRAGRILYLRIVPLTRGVTECSELLALVQSRS